MDTKRSSDRVPSLSPKEAEILSLLSSQGELYGLEIVRCSEGRIKRGTIYTTLSRMEDKGLVVSRPEQKPPHVPGIPRRLYAVTPYGARVLQAQEIARAFLQGSEAPA